VAPAAEAEVEAAAVEAEEAAGAADVMELEGDRPVTGEPNPALMAAARERPLLNEAVDTAAAAAEDATGASAGDAAAVPLATAATAAAGAVVPPPLPLPPMMEEARERVGSPIPFLSKAPHKGTGERAGASER
jgi:hypothetical protein